MRVPPFVRPRDPIRAEDTNRLVAWLRSVIKVKTGPGLASSWNENGLKLWLSSAPSEYVVPAIVLSRTGDDPDIGPNISYTVGALGQFTQLPNGDYQGFVLKDVFPSFGRPYKGSESDIALIRPAAIGAMCFILRYKDPENAWVSKLAIMPGGSDGETPHGATCPENP